ncbi:oligosaccharide flippase family protein [Acinetobacter shaoyimingii]|uniref:Oligosaccharide flippase family protein n=1 Tax=Acinetobacter shaoyimingii TaxID=2715164 RepID=A0A6G8RRY4_9GAMM|nr:oligosaccharide flippase family protein [Acinetobacter shaoyimingii]QIO04548.1 oligosaccharide flippase family protein [Acinetobacter shaoyimingii]
MNKRIILNYAIGPVGSGLLSLISLPLITWFYSAEDIGRISIFQIYINFCILLFCMGLDQAYVRDYHESQNKAELLKNLSFPIIVLTIIVLLGVLLIFPNFISSHLYDINSIYLSSITVLAFIAAVISRYLSLILRMQEKALQFSMSQILPKILFLIFIVNVVVFQIARDTNSLVTANALSVIAACLVYIWNTRHELKSALQSRINTEVLRKGFIFGFPLLFSSLAGWGLGVADRLFLKNYSTLSELGIYSVTMSVATVATLFAGIFNTIWAPLVYKWQSTQGIEFDKLNSIAINVVAIVYFIVVLSGLFSWIVTFFFPAQYSNIQYLLPACLLAPLLYTVSEVTGIGISLSRRTVFTMFSSLIAMTVSIAVCYFMVPLFGAKGAACATVLAFFVFYIARSEFSKLLIPEFNFRSIYMATLLILIVSIANLFLTDILRYALWIILLFIGLVIFKTPLSQVQDYCSNYLKRKS